ncbi:nucleotidyltransferase family protein [Legionella maceachernii]|uniref:Glucose-1-phosphate cytidylyltransferase (CDP-glucose pyrophosphorylase) n=1 Tax=Legionella maceachernii TaxID=466 RepID=A0A0W0VVZ9_9GAMM|nr:nucleotidyltransferase family protein [Legionella maceachernii]KTD24145.1 glucose-1-phosphate cytidylyltransferase (CDP-glucose pyrophosphorylase) [Legionella maceachernii]SJZ87323.1 D-glycero-alpha-D-manno-heptose 1-phosphate guanylyltransferase [Legionella maceachernii]SUO98948.1 Glucose-1-phosphate cytidylyltransferase [Legionella maceachernii]
MTTTAVILAGGLGTRLRTVVSDVPKPMAPIHGRPFLEYLLDYWIAQGIKRFVLSIGYKYEIIVGHFGDSYKGVALDYVIESTPMGTGGGLLLAIQKIEADTSFLVLNGDTYFAVNLQQLVQFAQENAADWCLSLFTTNNTARYMGMDVLPEGEIKSLTPKKEQLSCLANGGVYWVRQQALMKNKIIPGDKISLENDILSQALLSKQRLFGLAFHGIFIDIGVPDDYQRAASLLNLNIRKYSDEATLVSN